MRFTHIDVNFDITNIQKYHLKGPADLLINIIIDNLW